VKNPQRHGTNRVVFLSVVDASVARRKPTAATRVMASEKQRPSGENPDAALRRLDEFGIAPPMEYGRFPDVKARFNLTRSTCYELIWSGKIKSCVVKRKGARHGVRLIDMASVREFLRSNTR
jgi:hypothetical protein